MMSETWVQCSSKESVKWEISWDYSSTLCWFLLLTMNCLCTVVRLHHPPRATCLAGPAFSCGARTVCGRALLRLWDRKSSHLSWPFCPSFPPQWPVQPSTPVFSLSPSLDYSVDRSDLKSTSAPSQPKCWAFPGPHTRIQTHLVPHSYQHTLSGSPWCLLTCSVGVVLIADLCSSTCHQDGPLLHLFQ